MVDHEKILKSEFPALSAEVKQVREELDALKIKVNEGIPNQTYADAVKQFVASSEELKSSVTKLQQEVGNIKDTHRDTNITSTVSVEPAISEIQERERRASNVLLFGVVESSKKDHIEMKNDDIQMVKNTLANLNEELPTDAKIIRIGNHSEDKRRPIKIILASRQEAIQILKKKAALEQVNSGIYMKSDQTPAQRKYLKEILVELDSRKNNGEKGIKIKYIKGIPTIIKSNISKN